MNKNYVCALDFDGVICDSAIETGISGWKAACKIWDDMPLQMPASFLQQFREVRPVLETGYEAILIVRLLFQNHTTHTILFDFARLAPQLLEKSNLSIDFLQHLFGATRDHWIQSNLSEWVANNPLFPGIATQLGDLISKNECYIITTKQERFVDQILKSNNVTMNCERIYGMDRGMSKGKVLEELALKYPDNEMRFVEDRLPTLVELIKEPALRTVNLKLFLNTWGFNTPEDRNAVTDQPIQLLSLDDFLNW